MSATTAVQGRPVPAAPNTGHPRRWSILAVLVVSLIVVVLDNTVLNVALKTIADPRHGLGASQSDLEWAINSYTLVFAGLLFTWGVLGDRLGRKKILVLGMVLFGLSSLASAYAQTPGQLIGARALMGLGGAAVLPATLSIISNVFDPRERGRAIGVWAGSVGIAVAIGPLLGGALLEHFWWGSVFLINVPIVLIGTAAILTLVPDSRDPRPGRIDLPGVLLSIAGLVLLVYGIISGGDHGFGKPTAWGSLVAAAAVLATFVYVERRIAFPSLDVRLFRNPRFSAAVSLLGLTFFAGFGTFFFVSFYLQLVRGYSPLQSGLLMVPFAAAQLFFAPRSATMVRRYGPRAVSAVGMALMAIALVGYVVIGVDSPIWVVAALFFVQGAAMANVLPPATESIMSTLPREKAGVGSAVGNTVRQVGGALGVAVLGTVLASLYRRGIDGQLTGLPNGARSAARQSVAGTYAVAERLGASPSAGRLVTAGNDAFVHAMHYASAVAVLISLVGVAVSLWLPRRSVAVPVGAESTGPAEAESSATPGEPTTTRKVPSNDATEVTPGRRTEYLELVEVE